MNLLGPYRLFISHAWAYSESYERLVNLLNEATPHFAYMNHSVPKHDPLIDPNTDVGNNTLFLLLGGQILDVNCVLVIAGMYVNHKYWIQKEIDIARQLSKPIIGLVPWGAERTPAEVQDAAVEMIGWNTDTIVKAIRKHSR
jgi:hypothetical protein